MFRTSDKLKSAVTIHGFFGRQGGVSGGIYGSLNCGLGSRDDAVHVRRNREIVCEALGAPVLSLYQIHSERCVVVHEPWEEPKRPEGDAMVTDAPGIALGILTADCAPVLFYGEKADGSPVIGAAHAGWGGALKGVLENTVAAMTKLGAVNIRAAIGPCIGPGSYEVSDHFVTPFLEQDAANRKFFAPGGRAGHQMFDLPGYVRRRLELAGAEVDSAQAADTYAAEESYFSYRRSVHRSEADYGRQVSVIAIKE